MRKTLAVLLAIFFAIGTLGVNASAAKPKKIDIAFVIDTTGSMKDDIAKVKSDMNAYVADLNESGMDYRIAIVDYRDFPSRNGSGASDYPYRVALDFSSNYDSIIAGINSLTLGNGGDIPETICSALIDGLSSISWRSEAGKVAILMGDAPALDPEPITGYTKDKAINKLLYDDVAYDEHVTASSEVLTQEDKRSSITLYAIATESYSSETVADFEYLSSKTGGKSYIAKTVDAVSEVIHEIIDEIPESISEPTKAETFFGILWGIIATPFLTLFMMFQQLFLGIGMVFALPIAWIASLFS